MLGPRELLDTLELEIFLELELEVGMRELEELIGATELLDGIDTTLEDDLLAGIEELLRGIDEGWLLELLPGAPPQTAPVITGFCAGLLATPLLPCTPNSINWPGLIRSFQPTPVAVNGLLPEILAFQPPVRVVPSV